MFPLCTQVRHLHPNSRLFKMLFKDGADQTLAAAVATKDWKKQRGLATVKTWLHTRAPAATHPTGTQPAAGASARGAAVSPPTRPAAADRTHQHILTAAGALLATASLVAPPPPPPADASTATAAVTAPARLSAVALAADTVPPVVTTQSGAGGTGAHCPREPLIGSLSLA